MTYDILIDDIGNFGWYQALLLAALSVPDMFCAFALLLPVFTGATPEMKCSNVSEEFKNISTAENVKMVDVCKMCNAYTYDESFTSIVTEWNLVCKLDYVSDLITTIQLSGLLLGAGIFGQVSDSFGRRKAYFIACSILVVAGVLSGFAPNWQVYSVTRFLVGLSTGGYFCVNCVYPLEFIGARWRTLCGTIGFWAVGEMLLALIAYYVRSWRILLISTSIAGTISFFVIWFTPESPRWLAQQNRIVEAKEIFSKIARYNKRPIPDMSYLDTAMDNEQMDTGRSQTYTYLHLFKTKKLTLRIVLVLLSWFTLFLTYYELSYNLRNLSGNRYFNMFLAGIVDQCAMFVVILFNNKIGRRNLQASALIVTIAANICMLSLNLLDKDDEWQTSYKISALLGKAAALTGTYAISIFTAELYPTCVRNLAVGAGSLAARFGALCAPQILYLGGKFALLPFLIILPLCILTLPLTYMHPETNGQPLTDDFQEFCYGKNGNTKEIISMKEVARLLEMEKNV